MRPAVGRVLRRAIVVAAIAACLALTATASARTDAQGERRTARVWLVTGTGASADQARRLATALGLDASLRNEDGSLEYLDSRRFLAAPTIRVDETGRDEDGRPTVTSGIDIEALAKLPVLSGAGAKKRAQATLKDAKLLPAGAVANVDHAKLTLYDKESRVTASAALDTSVGFSVALDGIPLRGPGAKIRMSFDGNGFVTHLRHAWRALRAGPTVPLVSVDDAKRECADRYGPSGARAEITASLLYFAPSLSLGDVRRIVPHYACSGTLPSGADLNRLVIPAVQDAPQVDVTMDVSSTSESSTVRGHAQVAGGRPPYTYSWGSSHTALDPAKALAGPDISYTPTGRNAEAPERLEVIVTDADGLTAASASIDNVVLELSHDTEPSDNPTVGLEWEHGVTDAHGFYFNAVGPDVDGAFERTPDEARERDFKDPAFGGEDTLWVDAVDFLFYHGHANGAGWTFQTTQDDTFIHYSEGRWGNRDLEWLAVEACGPLRPLAEGKDVVQRWGPTFDGLHILLGFANIIYEINGQADEFADLMLGNGGPPVSIVDAWATSAIDIQEDVLVSDDSHWAAMGPSYSKLVFTGPGGNQPKFVSVNNKDDFFWNRGGTGADISAAQTEGYWVLDGPVD